MKYNLIIVSTVLFLVVVILPKDSYAAKPLKLCMATDGSINAKIKCKRNEAQVDASALQAIVAAEAGPQGPKGDKGDKGLQGPAGPQGMVGPQGSKGDKGSQGLAGPQGLVGPQGPKGDKGDAGAQGPIGVSGPKGDKGDPGIINVAACTHRYANNSRTTSGWLWTKVTCVAGEFLLTHGLQLPNNDNAFIQEDTLYFWTGTSIPAGIEYVTWDADGHSVNVVVVCCPIN